MFEYTELDKEKVIKGYFVSLNPLKLRQFPPKQKRKYITLIIILEKFQKGKFYTEGELNEILEDIYPDYVSLRRGLIDFRLMCREKDCSKYWINPKE